MVWTPQKNVIDLTTIADNLLEFIALYDEDALDWANGGPGLVGFTKLYTNASGRLQTEFPSLMILAQESETDLTGDMIEAGLQLVLEGTISGPDADELVANTKKYARAVESLLTNIPADTLTANSEPEMGAWIFEIETKVDILTRISSAFLQVFQVRVIYRLAASGYQN